MLVRPATIDEPAPEVVVLAADDVLWARIGAALAHSGAVLRRVHPAEDPAGADLLLLASVDLATGDVALLQELRRGREEMPIISVCLRASARTVRRALDAGVAGFVAVDNVESALLPTIAAVLAGQTVVPAEFGGLRRESLSFREKQILGFVVLGLTNSQIARRLFLAESTVKSHLSSSFAKLGVASRSDAAALILNPHEAVGASILKLTEQLPAADRLPVA